MRRQRLKLGLFWFLLPGPRGFWDYALFALFTTGLLTLMFWLKASNGIAWADAALAFAAAVLGVLAIVLVRRGEKARWIAQPTWHAYALMVLGACGLLFGAMFADAYLLHRSDITSRRLWHDVLVAVGIVALMLWSSRRRFLASTPD